MSTTFHITNTNVNNSSMSPTNDASPEAQAVLINKTIVAAGMWLNSFVKGQGSIEITVNFGAPIPTVNGGSLSNLVTGSFAVNGISHPLRQDSALYEMQVGIDVNASASDAVINVRADPDFYYWFDPTLTSSFDIPSNKTDGFRIMLHELLHIIGINGWVCYGGTGSDYSTYDQYVVTQNGRSFFTGSNAVKAFGGFVPITNAHLGDEVSINAGILTGSQTVMSIGSVPNGVRISLDPIVIGVLRDLGYTVRDTQAVYSGEDGRIDTATIHGSLTEYAVTHTGFELAYTYKPV